eukprot:5651666-Lingulodinium_polyedra.AAC.1
MPRPGRTTARCRCHRVRFPRAPGPDRWEGRSGRCPFGKGGHARPFTSFPSAPLSSFLFWLATSAG